MREEIANLVHPVFNHALRLKERLERGETPDLNAEQAALKGLLLSEFEAQRWADFGGQDGGLDNSLLRGSRGTEAGRPGGDAFLGVRYALVCWLDEIFIGDSPWSELWSDRKLETALYGSNDRAWKFWEQARQAEARSGTDVLEVFYLCVMFGFRGDLREEPAKLQAWANTTQTRISKSQGQEWPPPPELDPPTHVPPRHGRQQLQTMVLVAATLLLLLVPAAMFWAVQQLLGW
jgi:type VI secretion system protein ImpK